MCLPSMWKQRGPTKQVRFDENLNTIHYLPWSEHDEANLARRSTYSSDYARFKKRCIDLEDKFRIVLLTKFEICKLGKPLPEKIVKLRKPLVMEIISRAAKRNHHS